MRRRTLAFLLLLAVLAVSTTSVVFWHSLKKDEKPFHSVLSSFRVQEQESLDLQGNVYLLQALRRLPPSSAGIPGQQHGKHTLTINTTSSCTQQQITHALLKANRLEIWNTGSIRVPENTSFDPRQYPSTIPNRKPLFTGADLDPNSLSMGQNELTAYYFINFSMKGVAAAKLSSFTAHNIGNYITITLDRVVVSSPKLQYVLPGKGQFQMSPRSFMLLGIKCTNENNRR